VTTVSVRKGRNGRSAIDKLSPLTTSILGCLDGSIDEIARKLTVKGAKWENRTPEEFLPEALRVLERAGLVTTSPTNQAGPSD
jgi:hypothetical protein